MTSSRLREPGGRRQPQCRAHGSASCRPTKGSSRSTVNRLCGSSMDAIGVAARAIKSARGGYDDRRRRREHVARSVRDGEGRDRRSAAAAETVDTTIGWRFVNPRMKGRYGVTRCRKPQKSSPRNFTSSRADQDAFALRTQQRWAAQMPQAFSNRKLFPFRFRRKKAIRRFLTRTNIPRPDTTLEASGEA